MPGARDQRSGIGPIDGHLETARRKPVDDRGRELVRSVEGIGAAADLRARPVLVEVAREKVVREAVTVDQQAPPPAASARSVAASSAA